MDTESQTRIDSGATDRELVQQMLAGDELAFDQFSESYAPALYRFALNRLSPDRELTREIVQATLCKAISKLDSFRGEAADAGELEMPSTPATIYNLGGPAEIFNPETGEVSGGKWVWAVYVPNDTEGSTGLPTTPQLPGAPWIMRPGTASSHRMVVQPREPKS
ncbi:MAG: hypothetical protein WBP34_06215 [Thermoanaerobaculia bacterium]